MAIGHLANTLAYWGFAVEPGVENLVANCPHTGGKLRRPELEVLFQQSQDIGKIVHAKRAASPF